MVVGYVLRAQDDDSYMLGESTYRPVESGGFYDWRFGHNGIPHQTTCATCGRKIAPDYIDPAYQVKKRKRDITTTYDGYILISERFRSFCLKNNYLGLSLLQLPNDKDFYWLRSNRTITFDVEKRRTRFEKFCNTCNSYFNIIGASPAFLKNTETPLATGFYRTDIEFGSGHEQHPIIIVAPQTGLELSKQKFKGFELESVEANP